MPFPRFLKSSFQSNKCTCGRTICSMKKYYCYFSTKVTLAVSLKEHFILCFDDFGGMATSDRKREVQGYFFWRSISFRQKSELKPNSFTGKNHYWIRMFGGKNNLQLGKGNFVQQWKMFNLKYWGEVKSDFSLFPKIHYYVSLLCTFVVI